MKIYVLVSYSEGFEEGLGAAVYASQDLAKVQKEMKKVAEDNAIDFEVSLDCVKIEERSAKIEVDDFPRQVQYYAINELEID